MNQPTLYDEVGLIDVNQMVVCFTLDHALTEQARGDNGKINRRIIVGSHANRRIKKRFCKLFYYHSV